MTSSPPTAPRLILLCPEPDALLPKSLLDHHDCQPPEAFDPDSPDFQASPGGDLLLFIGLAREAEALAARYPALLGHPDCRFLPLERPKKIGPAEITEALLGFFAERDHLLAETLLAQAALRQMYERLQERFAALEAHAAQNGLAAAPLVFANAPSPGNRVYAGPKLREMLRDEGVDYLQLRQPLPACGPEIRCIGIGLEVREALTGQHRIALRGRGAGNDLLSWTLPAGFAPSDPLLRLALPEGLELPHDLDLVLDLDVVEETGRLECIGSGATPDPDTQAWRNGAPVGFPLHLQLWAQTPGSPGTAPAGALPPDSHPAPTRWLLDETHLRAATCLEPEDHAAYDFAVVGFSRGVLTVHPVTGSLTTASIPLAGLSEARQMRAYVQNGHGENDGVEMRLALPDAEASGGSSATAASQWIYLDPESHGVLELALPEGADWPEQLLVQSRLPQGAQPGNAWAQLRSLVAR